MEKREITIPFFGFYNSIYDSEMDSNIEQEGEYLEEQYSPKTENPWDICDSLSSNCNWSQVRQEFCEPYIDAFEVEFCHECIDIEIEFSVMTSPREYNFLTDRLFASISEKSIKALYAISKKNQHIELIRIIKERFTSYDGFLSNYSNELQDWMLKPVLEWDCNELETLLLAVMAYHGVNRNDFEMEVYSSGNLHETISNSVSNAIDWHKVESDLGIKGLVA